MYKVAPFTGAWIEISQAPSGKSNKKWSHPSRVRGLKYRHRVHQPPLLLVAPFTGAWIEMKKQMHPSGCSCRSHPSRVRGLKCIKW